MGDIQTTKAAETPRVKQKTEDRPPHEHEPAPRAWAEATLFRAAASDDPRTPPRHLARVLRRLTVPQQTTFLLQCQRHYGNAYVQRMVYYLDDSQCAPGPSTGDETLAHELTHVVQNDMRGAQNHTLQTRPLAVPITPIVQRQRATEEKEAEPIQAKSDGSLSGSFEAGAEVETQVSLSKGRRSPLPDPVRTYIEPRFGADFSAVRVHTGSDARQMNQAVGAQAFTHGSDIYSGAGDSPTNLTLKAHDLTHVVQQTGGGPLRTNKLGRVSLTNTIQRARAADGEGGIEEKASAPSNAILTRTEGKPSNKSSVVPKHDAGAEKASAAQGKQASKSFPAAAKAAKDTAAGAEDKTLRSPASRKKAPDTPEEDPAYQAVVAELETKAALEKAPEKKPEQKQQEMIRAASLTSDEIGKQNAYSNHLDALESVQPRELTVELFMGEFKATTNQVAETLPKTNAEHGTVHAAARLGAAKALATTQVANQTKTHSDPLRTEAAKTASNYQDTKKDDTKAPQLEVDPVGATLAIKQADAAAPKPRTPDEISLDDKSRSLDEALLNHNAGGQTINIDEDSLAFSKSGEQSFDEAAETKRKAQDEIKKAPPRYREEERAVIGKSQDDIQSLVNTGLQGYHAARSKSFNEVLGAQKTHQSILEGKKRAVFGEIEGIYTRTKTKVNEELAKLQGIEEVFEGILKEAQDYFDDLVRTDLEYIYTPGMLDYSDWKDKHEKEIAEEFERQKRLTGDEDSFPFHPAYTQALKIVRDRSAAKLFENARTIFIGDVNRKVEEKIAKPVVAALNAARKHIQDGKDQVNKAFDGLDPKEQEEARNVLEAVVGRFEQLDESVADRQHEIVADMARTYNQSVGNLKAKFDAIKKDVLTSWFEKAWNKIKAVVNAIIDFATRIVELLGRLAYLVGDIVSSPRAFFSNLVNGIGQGFSTFVKGIGEFLATAFFDWLRGSSGLPIQMPKDWEPKGIFSLFLQLLNLSTETIWERMETVYDKTVANAFRRGEVLLDKGLEIFDIVKREGLSGLWEEIKTSLGNVLNETLEMIKESVLYAAVKKAILEIGKLLVPGGGFIVIAEKIFRLLQFIVEARNKILDLIEAFVDSVEMAVKGNVPGIVKHITGALTKFITVALDFLVTFFGLGSLKEKVTRFIERMRKPVIRGIDWVLGKLKPVVMKGKRVLEAGKEKVVGAGKAVVQIGLPKDPNERLRLAARASVSAARRLTGSVTQALLNPILAGIKVRYGLQALQPYEKGGTWWVRATINPTVDTDTGVSSITPVSQAGSEPTSSVDVRELASRALEHELRDIPSRAEAQKIVVRVAEKLRPQGLRSLEIGPESPEKVATIYAEASDKEPLGELVNEAPKQSQEVSERVSVRTKARLEFSEAVTLPTGPYESTHGREATRVTGGTVEMLENPTVWEIVGWNVTAWDRKVVSDHAEDQFIKRLKELDEKSNIIKKIVGIHLQNFDLSPCDLCCDALRSLLNTIREAQTGNPKLKTAKISWQKLYGEKPRKDPDDPKLKLFSQNSATVTTWSGIRALTSGRGWETDAPASEYPIRPRPGAAPEKMPEDIYGRWTYKRRDVRARVKPQTEGETETKVGVRKR
jgi:hypothetical protein